MLFMQRWLMVCNHNVMEKEMDEISCALHNMLLYLYAEFKKLSKTNQLIFQSICLARLT
jgi:hypothetical protein